MKEDILTIVEPHTAGSPVNEKIKWTYLKLGEIVAEYKKQFDKPVSPQVVQRVLKQADYVKRKPVKNLATGESPHREEQFQIIHTLLALFSHMPHNPILSIDTKKKERLGLLTRNQALLSTGQVSVFDHDYDYLAEGRAVPHAIYDPKLNKGYVTIGTNHETAAFLADNLIWWWDEFGIDLYPDTSHLLTLWDSGGANSYRHYAFKKELLRVAQTIGKNIVVAHYPPYCSKYNPIERRLFPHMHQTLDGTILTSHEQVKTLFQRTKTKVPDNPLSAEVRIEPKQYPSGITLK